jgi:biotin synthase-related radical SAM superfamily protein
MTQQLQEMEKEVKESPEYLRMSLSSAMALRLRGGRFYRNAKSPCVNLLMTYDEGCFANCAYCGLARERSGEYVDKSFIRVEWPIYSLDEIIESIRKYQESEIKRVCISMITNRRGPADLVTILRRLRPGIEIPISLLVSPTILSDSDFVAFKEEGADRIGIAVDAATPELFDQIRGKAARGPHRWDTYWKKIETSMSIFGNENVGVHFVVGIGETEKEMIQAIQRVRDMGGSTHLFSFFPESGSRFADKPQPPIGQYRRIQLGRYLIDEDLGNMKDFTFDPSDRISDFGLPEDELNRIIDSGKPFETSGCPGEDGEVACNRPYANSLPGPDVRNYPFPLRESDIARVKKQLR